MALLSVESSSPPNEAAVDVAPSNVLDPPMMSNVSSGGGGGGGGAPASNNNSVHNNKNINNRAVDKIHILQQLARGVAELHEAAVVHADIKSSNIFLTEHKPAFVRLGDFGEAVKGSRSIDLSVVQGTFRRHGTLRYNAPEMLAVDLSGLRAKPTRKTDVYAFGLVCHEVLCKKNTNYHSKASLRN